MFFIIFFGVLALVLMITFIKATYLVKQAEVVIIERFGEYHRVLQSGLNIIMPFVDKPRISMWTFVKEDNTGKHYYRYTSYVERIDLRESVYDFPKQNVITKDNVTMEINALLYYQITDPKAAIYEVANLPQAIEKLTQTTLRNVIGSLDLDESLTSRDRINDKLREILDEATDKWGVKINRVELQEVNPPLDIRHAMEKQMRAERDRRALILEAEGKKQSEILTAEGDKLARITRAEGEAESRKIVAAGESDAIAIIQQAIPDQNPLPYLIALKYIQALPEITKGAEGKTVVIPYEASAVLGSISTIKELFQNK